MIVALEGLSCAGKSALSAALSAQDDSTYEFIPEFMVDVSNGVTTTLCMANDVAKAVYAKLINRTDKCVIMDRSYLSTLVYTYAGSPKEHLKLKDWYDNELLAGRLEEPDLIIYLRIKPKTSLERAKSIGRFNDKYAWYTHSQEAFDKYDDYLNGSLLSEKCITIDCDAAPTKVLAKRINEIIKRRLKG